MTRTNDGSTVEFTGAIDSTTNWIPSSFGFFAATNTSVTIDAVLTRAPWNGDVEVRYTCTDLRAGFRYDEVFRVTVNGVEKCVTNAVPTLDSGYASLSKSFVIRGEELFGPDVKDEKAKVRIELVPIPPEE